MFPQKIIMSSKRKRDPTFTFGERNILLDIVVKHFSIVEAKKTDAYTIKQKNEEWCKIATEFNSLSSVHPREWNVLKNCWENLKKRAKQEQTLRNQHFLGTGGGPPLQNKDDPIINRVLELIQARVSGFINVYDSDGTRVLACSNTEPVVSQEYKELETEPQEIENTQATSTADAIIIDWSQYTPSMLRDQKNPVLQAVSQSPPSAQKFETEEYNIEVNTPLQSHKTKEKTSRRRPMYEKSDAHNLYSHRVKTLEKANVYAEEEHELKLKILRLQEEKENVMVMQEKSKAEQETFKTEQEKLKTEQEIIKLEIYKYQLMKLKD